MGGKPLRTGGVYAVKPLGAYAMIDEGELDWKVVAIRADDPAAPRIADIADVERRVSILFFAPFGIWLRMIAWRNAFVFPAICC